MTQTVIEKNRNASNVRALSRALPPLPWTGSYATTFQDRTLADHILRKKPLASISTDTEEYSNISTEWEDAVRPPQVYESTAATYSTKSSSDLKPKIITSNYSAERLLHPWQRGIDKLRRQVVTTEQTFQHPLSSKINLYPIRESKSEFHIDREHQNECNGDADSDDENLGWNPFVIKIDGSNVSILDSAE